MPKTIHNYTWSHVETSSQSGWAEAMSGWAEAFGSGENDEQSILKWEDCYALTEEIDIALEGRALVIKIHELFLSDYETEIDNEG